MAKLFDRDVYALGLFYSYLYAGKTMVLKDDLDLFYQAVETNLAHTDVLDMYATVRYDYEPDLFYMSEGKNADTYCVLRSDVYLYNLYSRTVACFSKETISASLQENALACLGLEIRDQKVCHNDTLIREKQKTRNCS